MNIHILNSYIHPTSYPEALAQILAWSSNAESRYVCCANVHMLMEAHDSHAFRIIVNSADLVTPDGMPLVWLMRSRGFPDQERVYGPTLMIKLLEAAAENGLPVGFIGGRKEVLAELIRRMQERFPKLRITCAISPPFTGISAEEDAALVRQVEASGAQILFIGLGCPKQEQWMYDHRGRVHAVMIGVGAAFDFHAGTLKQAPLWMQKAGLEWFFRFTHEPARLWKRYLYHNPRFVILSLLEQIRYWFGKKEKGE